MVLLVVNLRGKILPVDHSYWGIWKTKLLSKIQEEAHGVWSLPVALARPVAPWQSSWVLSMRAVGAHGLMDVSGNLIPAAIHTVWEGVRRLEVWNSLWPWPCCLLQPALPAVPMHAVMWRRDRAHRSSWRLRRPKRCARFINSLCLSDFRDDWLRK